MEHHDVCSVFQWSVHLTGFTFNKRRSPHEKISEAAECNDFPLIHSGFPFRKILLERHTTSQWTIYFQTFWHLMSVLPDAKVTTVGGTGYLKPDVPTAQQPNGHGLTSS